MLLVANMVYLNDLDKGADDAEVYGDFFRALFHDLPEVLTKDVISPVKNSIDGLNKLLEDYERSLWNRRYCRCSRANGTTSSGRSYMTRSAVIRTDGPDTT
jgi:5'-deoxynucleotidase YfbR-like HD superfamily hydrolase